MDKRLVSKEDTEGMNRFGLVMLNCQILLHREVDSSEESIHIGNTDGSDCKLDYISITDKFSIHR